MKAFSDSVATLRESEVESEEELSTARRTLRVAKMEAALGALFRSASSVRKKEERRGQEMYG